MKTVVHSGENSSFMPSKLQFVREKTFQNSIAAEKEAWIFFLYI